MQVTFDDRKQLNRYLQPTRVLYIIFESIVFITDKEIYILCIEIQIWMAHGNLYTKVFLAENYLRFGKRIAWKVIKASFSRREFITCLQEKLFLYQIYILVLQIVGFCILSGNCAGKAMSPFVWTTADDANTWVIESRTLCGYQTINLWLSTEDISCWPESSYSYLEKYLVLAACIDNMPFFSR